MGATFAGIALALIAGLAPIVSPALAAGQDDATGFVEGSKLSVINRVVYERLDYLKGDTFRIPKLGRRYDLAEESGYGLMLGYQSGFTRGPVGFGLDAFAFGALNLHKNPLENGRQRYLPTDAWGGARNGFARGGAAVKLRLSATELKAGDMRTKNPVFSSSDSRLLPETNRGWLITSQDLPGFALQAGRFTGWGDRIGSSNTSPVRSNYSGKAGAAFAFAGGTWSGRVPGLSVTSYLARFEDNWDTWYVGGKYRTAIADAQSLTFVFNLYRNTSAGAARSGSVNNTTWSLMGTWSAGAHSFGLGYQKVNGDTPFDYVNRGSIWLTNSMQLSDFNGPNEASWQARYDVDLGAALTPGLSFSAALTRGAGIDGSRTPAGSPYAGYYGRGGRHWECDLLIRYEVAQGPAKGMSMYLRYGMHRTNKAQGEANMDQIRIGAEIPVNLLEHAFRSASAAP